MADAAQEAKGMIPGYPDWYLDGAAEDDPAIYGKDHSDGDTEMLGDAHHEPHHGRGIDWGTMHLTNRP